MRDDPGPRAICGCLQVPSGVACFKGSVVAIYVRGAWLGCVVSGRRLWDHTSGPAGPVLLLARLAVPVGPAPEFHVWASFSCVLELDCTSSIRTCVVGTQLPVPYTVALHRVMRYKSTSSRIPVCRLLVLCSVFSQRMLCMHTHTHTHTSEAEVGVAHGGAGASAGQ